MFIKQLGDLIKKECRSLNEEINFLRTELNVLKNSNISLNSLPTASAKIGVAENEAMQQLISEIQLLRAEVNDLKERNLDLVKSCQIVKTSQSSTDSSKDINHISTNDTNVSYAKKLQNSSECGVIIKPKNSSQSVKQTKSEILHTLKPLPANIEINKVKVVSNGGLLIKCANKQQSDNLISIADDKLSNNYNVKKTTTILPRVRIVGIPEGLNKDEIASYALSQNSHLFSKDALCKVQKISSTSKSKDTLQAECLVDLDSYKNLLDNGHLLIGLNGCSVFDALTILRCFNCNGYNHGSGQCKKEPVCPLCAQSHNLKACPNQRNDDNTKLCCSNCLSIRNLQHLEINTSHAAWDYKQCFAYKSAQAKIKQDVFNMSTPIEISKPKPLLTDLS